MTYANAAADCASRSGTLAMATDTYTFETLRDVLTLYFWAEFDVYLSSGRIEDFPYGAAWVDGSDQLINTSVDGFYCATVGGACPDTMPWNTVSYIEPDRTSLPNCAKVTVASLPDGLHDHQCDKKLVRICDIPS